MRPVNILIEGADCAGKSTLAKELKNYLSWDTISLAHRPGYQLSRFLSLYSSLTHTIFERGHISEIVYSQLYGRSDPFQAHEEKILRDVVGSTMIVIHARPTIHQAVARYQSREHVLQPIKLTQLASCIERFDEAFRPYTVDIEYGSRDWAELDQVVQTVQELV